MNMSSSKVSHLIRMAGLVTAAGVLAGCMSQAPAPVRGDGTIPESAQPTMAAVKTGQYHIVRAGDTLMGIGRTYNRSVADLVAWNNLDNPHQIRVGQQVLVSPPGLEAAGTVGDGGVVVMPIDLSGTSTDTAPTVSAPQVVSEPKGGRTPYSDEAWAAVKPQPTAPATIPSPEPSEPEGGGVPAEWQWPASGEILARFDEATNKGVSIAGKPGDPVRASKAGSVVYAGSGLRGYGKLVIIKHDEDFLTAYAHNQTLLVKEGEEVQQGQQVAELGSTDADRPKLHFEIRRQGRPVDPMQYLTPR